MDSSHISLPNVDRANSTLFKRYLEEQHKSIINPNTYQQITHPIQSTIQITHTHTHRQQHHQETYTTKLNNHNQPILVKRKYSKGRKPSVDTSKQRSSHTSRFMKRFQRQHKNGETITNVQKRDGKARFEFHDPSTIKPIQTDQERQCTCYASSNRNRGENYQHHHHCPAKQTQVPRLSLNELFHSTNHQRRQLIQGPIPQPPPLSPPKHSRSPLPMLPPATAESIHKGSVSNLTYQHELNRHSSPSIEPSTIVHTESETIILDPPAINLSDEYYPIVNDFLQELSREMNDKISVDIMLEIEESLAQRIYDCVVEHDDVNENENDTKSYSTTITINDSSALSAIPPPPTTVNNLNTSESNDLPPSPINSTTRDVIDNQEKYFQPIREQVPTSFNNLLDRNRHSTPFQRLTKQIPNDIRSPFTQSLFEPVNLLRTVNDDNDDFNFFPSTFSFDNQQNFDLKLPQQSKSELPQTTTSSYFNHLLPLRPTPIEKTNSAFKPIEPANQRSTTTIFPLKRPQVKNISTGVNWFGQS